MREITARMPITRDEMYEALKSFHIRGGLRNDVEPTLILFPKAWLTTFRNKSMWGARAERLTRLAMGDTFALFGCIAIVVPVKIGFHIGLTETLETLIG